MFREWLCKLLHRRKWRKGRWYYLEDRPYQGVRYVICDRCNRYWTETIE